MLVGARVRLCELKATVPESGRVSGEIRAVAARQTQRWQLLQSRRVRPGPELSASDEPSLRPRDGTCCMFLSGVGQKLPKVSCGWSVLRPCYNSADFIPRGFRFIKISSQLPTSARMLSSSSFQTLKLSSPTSHVCHVEINRPEKRNAMNHEFWMELKSCFESLAQSPECRSIILSGAGKCFSSGIDLKSFAEKGASMMAVEDVGRRAKMMRDFIISYQESFSSLEKCPKPVIAAIHGACIGGGVDLICTADIRYCTQDAQFQIKEVDIGVAADVGTLQRMPKIIGSESLMRELAYTARFMGADEARQCGLVSRIFPDKDSMMKAVLALAELISTKSPVAIQGTKANLNYSRDHGVSEALDYMATWNMAMLQTEDLMKSAIAQMEKSKTPPIYSNL
ncbi:unnamed protein product [Darwinula stevensoni]|uniref:Delta(3,5)-Delta(2,4)-dienoyl-CoA isomerase, mitochondrial n=1 Tax=Darwinula stevensoni TaxID=69355 RepID=A0A7R9ACT1_9CRUS|nr:unnamed protein product [Darwinula stevensoni]CAG0900469.1 unnamed protein product [Darwinula stevensoni]